MSHGSNPSEALHASRCVVVDSLRNALRLDELYRTVERTTGDARTSAMVEVVAIRKQIREAITALTTGRELVERIRAGMQRQYAEAIDGNGTNEPAGIIRGDATAHDQATGLRRMAV